MPSEEQTPLLEPDKSWPEKAQEIGIQVEPPSGTLHIVGKVYSGEYGIPQ